jgi:hypothetical protein
MLMQFREKIAVYIEDHRKPINRTYRVTDYKNSWYIYYHSVLKS